jgi:thymidine kinase
MNATKEQYKTYLESRHWEEFSSKIRQKRGKCEKCGMDNYTSLRKQKQRLNVHYKTYERIGKEKPEDVLLLCNACHMAEHGLDGLAEFCIRFAMPEVRKITVICANCNQPAGFTVWNVDELQDVLCWVCRE